PGLRSAPRSRKRHGSSSPRAAPAPSRSLHRGSKLTPHELSAALDHARRERVQREVLPPSLRLALVAGAPALSVDSLVYGEPPREQSAASGCSSAVLPRGSDVRADGTQVVARGEELLALRYARGLRQPLPARGVVAEANLAKA